MICVVPLIICSPRNKLASYAKYVLSEDFKDIWSSSESCFVFLDGKIVLWTASCPLLERLRIKELKNRFKKQDLELVKKIFSLTSCTSVYIGTEKKKTCFNLSFDIRLLDAEDIHSIMRTLFNKMIDKEGLHNLHTEYQYN